MKSIPKDQSSKEKIPFSEFIELIKKKYPTPEERLSFINQIPEKDPSGKILFKNIKKKALLIQILM